MKKHILIAILLTNLLGLLGACAHKPETTTTTTTQQTLEPGPVTTTTTETTKSK